MIYYYPLQVFFQEAITLAKNERMFYYCGEVIL